jgi:Tfp pilus assembly protein PilF
VTKNLKNRLALTVPLFFLWGGACTAPFPEKPKSSVVPAVVMYDLGVTHLRSGEYFQARLSLEQAVALDPSLGRLPQAMESFREALKLNSQFPDAHNNLGVTLAQSGKPQEAIAAFEKALSFPAYNSPEIVHQNLGETYYTLGRYQEAAKALNTALRLNADMAITYYTLGLVYERQMRQQDALAAYNSAVKIAPQSEAGHKAQERIRSLSR